MTLNRPRTQWKDREHLFTPENITKYEFAARNEKRYPQHMIVKISPKPLSNGPVITVDKCTICMRSKVATPWSCQECSREDAMMRLGSQLPEDRSGEPETFYLGKEVNQ